MNKPVKPTAELNQMLKDMWALDEKRQRGTPLTWDERRFYINNFTRIKQYYITNAAYWIHRENL